MNNEFLEGWKRLRLNLKNKILYLDAIAHWLEIYLAYKNEEVKERGETLILLKNGKIIDMTADGCAYCKEYKNCKGCPLAQFGSHSACQNTPYYRVMGDKTAKNALEMLEFIRVHPPEGMGKLPRNTVFDSTESIALDIEAITCGTN